MRILDVFNLLAQGELHNIFLSEDAIQIREDKKQVVLNALNLGLTELYTRFHLKEDYYNTELTGEKFLLKIPDDEFLEVLTIQLNGKELCQQDYHLKQHNTILFDENLRGKVSIKYKANHRKLIQNDLDNNSHLDLPSSHVQALCYFMGARFCVSIVNQLDGDLNESQRYLQLYLQEIERLNQAGIDVDFTPQLDLFRERGFV